MELFNTRASIVFYEKEIDAHLLLKKKEEKSQGLVGQANIDNERHYSVHRNNTV